MKEVLSVFLCGKVYGFDVGHMRGIENYIEPARVGTEIDMIDGFVMIREEQIPIINVKKRLVLPPTPVTDETKLLLLNTQNGTVGVMVDGVTGIFRAEGDDVQDFPMLMNADNTNYGEYIARNGKDLVIAINPSHLLTDEEWGSLEQYKDDLKEDED